MKRFLTSAKRVVLSLALVAVCLAVANPVLAGNAANNSVAGTAWRTPMTLPDGEKGYLGVAFHPTDASFLMLIADSNDKVLHRIEGSYALANGTLTLYVDGKVFAQEKVVLVGAITLVTEDKNGKSTSWSRVDVD